MKEGGVFDSGLRKEGMVGGAEIGLRFANFGVLVQHEEFSHTTKSIPVPKRSAITTPPRTSQGGLSRTLNLKSGLVRWSLPVVPV